MNDEKFGARFIARIISALAITAAISLFGVNGLIQGNTVYAATVSEFINVGMVRGGLKPYIDDTIGSPGGFTTEYLKQALGKSPSILEISTFESQDALNDAACRGEVDILLDSSHTASHENCFIYSNYYYKSANVAVTQPEHSHRVSSGHVQSLYFAIEKGTFFERFIRQNYPRASFVLTRTTQEALDSVRTGAADIYIGPRDVVENAIRENRRFDALVVQDSPAGTAFDLRFAIAKGKPELRALLNAGIAAIGPEARTQILAKWISTSYNAEAPDDGFNLTEAEQRYLKSLPTIRTSLIVRFTPFSYLDDSGHLTGILPEYLQYLSQRLGLRFTQHAQQSPGAEGEALKAGATDLIVYVVPLDATAPPPGVTHAVETFPVIVAGRRDAAAVTDIAQLGRARVAVVQRSRNLEFVHQRAPHAVTITAPSLEQAMKLVRDGNADVVIGNLAAVDYYLQRGYGDDIKVLGTTGYQQAIGFQLGRGLEPLIPIIDRAIASMPESQRMAIRNRHLSTSYELGLRWRDVWTRAAPFVLTIGIGAIVLLISYGRLRKEVRRRKISEQMLQTQLRFRETLLDMVPIPIAIRDKRGAYIDVNAAGIDAMNTTKEAIIGKTLDEYVTSTTPGSLPQIVRGFMRHDRRYDGVHIDYVDANGAQKHGLYWHRPFHDENGNIEGSAGAIVDLTEVLSAQEQMRAAQALLTDLTDSLPAAVFQMKRSPDGAWSFPYVGGDRSLFPRSAHSDSPGLAWTLSAEDASRLDSALDATSLTLGSMSLDLRAGPHATGRWVCVNAVARREGDGGTLWNGYWSDTTIAHARARELELARDEAERLSSAKDRFLAVMSHEIRTPMSGVLGLVEVLEKSQLGAEQAIMVRMIRESGNALLKLLDNILDFSKIEATKLDLEHAVFDLREECDLVMGILSGRAYAKGITLRCWIDRDVAARVIGDSLRLRQVLFNLLSNAIKFTANGTVALHIDVEKGDAHSQALCIRVQDTGIGIDEPALDKLFEPFVQAHSSTSRRYGGTGLGLLISRKLAELMGGSLALKSATGKGTTVSVRIVLPISERRVTRPSSARDDATVLLLMHDKRVAADLRNRLDVLGIRAKALDTSVAHTFKQGASLIFVDAANRHIAASLSDDVICITENPEPAGFKITDAGVFLSVNPLYMRALETVYEHVKSGIDAISAHEALSLVHMPKPPSREEAVQRGSLILVAEDNPVNRHLIRSQLRMLGCVCDLVDDGVQALIAYDACRYAILLTDCHMPRIDGYELATHIRTRELSENAAPMPIVGVTASAESHEAVECMMAGMNDCIRKPASLEALRAILEKWAPVCLADLAVNELETRRADTTIGNMDEQLLVVLVHSLREDALSLRALLQACDARSLKQWLHRTTGAVAALHYTPLLEALSEFRTFVVQGKRDDIRKAGQLLLDKLDHLTARLATPNQMIGDETPSIGMSAPDT